MHGQAYIETAVIPGQSRGEQRRGQCALWDSVALLGHGELVLLCYLNSA